MGNLALICKRGLARLGKSLRGYTRVSTIEPRGALPREPGCARAYPAQKVSQSHVTPTSSLYGTGASLLCLDAF